jgi:hypothetical protein
MQDHCSLKQNARTWYHHSTARPYHKLFTVIWNLLYIVSPWSISTRRINNNITVYTREVNNGQNIVVNNLLIWDRDYKNLEGARNKMSICTPSPPSGDTHTYLFHISLLSTFLVFSSLDCFSFLFLKNKLTWLDWPQ